MRLVWSSGNGIGHINKVKQRRTRLVMGWWPLVGLPSWYLSRQLRPTQPGHHSVGRCNE